MKSMKYAVIGGAFVLLAGCGLTPTTANNDIATAQTACANVVPPAEADATAIAPTSADVATAENAVNSGCAGVNVAAANETFVDAAVTWLSGLFGGAN